MYYFSGSSEVYKKKKSNLSRIAQLTNLLFIKNAVGEGVEPSRGS